MKKWLFPVAALALSVLTACSSNESRQVANDSYEKNGDSPTFTKLDTAGITILGQDNTYQLPATDVNKGAAVDIRPPASPMAIIGNSVARFDGERSFIAYPVSKADIYNLKQIERLLTEDGITFKTEGNIIRTDWAPTGRADEIGDVQIRYIIEQAANKEASLISVGILEMKRNGIIFTPSITDTQRYTADRLNRFIGKLNNAYHTQMQQVATTNSTGSVQTAIVTDQNGHTALAMTVPFDQAWQRLGSALDTLGFHTKEETPGRGYRLLKYEAKEPNDWLRLGVTRPELKDDEYSMQLSSYGQESGLVIMNEKKEALSGTEAQAVYQALQAILAK